MNKVYLQTDTVYVVEKIQHNKHQDENLLTVLAAYVPLLQTLLWIAFAAGLLYFFRKELVVLREAITSRLKDGSGIKVGIFELGEIRKEVNVVKNDLQKTNDRIFRLFITTMSEDLYLNLQKIASGSFGKFNKSKGLTRELYYLRDLGYVSIPSISDIPMNGEDLSKYVSITSIGHEFIKLREEVLKGSN